MKLNFNLFLVAVAASAPAFAGATTTAPTEPTSHCISDCVKEMMTDAAPMNRGKHCRDLKKKGAEFAACVKKLHEKDSEKTYPDKKERSGAWCKAVKCADEEKMNNGKNPQDNKAAPAGSRGGKPEDKMKYGKGPEDEEDKTSADQMEKEGKGNNGKRPESPGKPDLTGKPESPGNSTSDDEKEETEKSNNGKKPEHPGKPESPGNSDKEKEEKEKSNNGKKPEDAPENKSCIAECVSEVMADPAPLSRAKHCRTTCKKGDGPELKECMTKLLKADAGNKFSNKKARTGAWCKAVKCADEVYGEKPEEIDDSSSDDMEEKEKSNNGKKPEHPGKPESPGNSDKETEEKEKSNNGKKPEDAPENKSCIAECVSEVMADPAPLSRAKHCRTTCKKGDGPELKECMTKLLKADAGNKFSNKKARTGAWCKAVKCADEVYGEKPEETDDSSSDDMEEKEKSNNGKKPGHPGKPESPGNSDKETEEKEKSNNGKKPNDKKIACVTGCVDEMMADPTPLSRGKVCRSMKKTGTEYRSCMKRLHEKDTEKVYPNKKERCGAWCEAVKCDIEEESH